MTRILTVDDSTSMRQMVNFTLKSAGYEVIEATHGKEAYEWAQANPAPDLIISDINMPHMDGITLVKHLRQLEDYKYTPILMLTTESSTEKKLEGKAAGATGWIVKPFNPEQLINTVKKIISTKVECGAK